MHVLHPIRADRPGARLAELGPRHGPAIADHSPVNPSHLVTGANGFLGRHLVRSLLSRGDRVTALARGADDRAARARVREAVGPAADSPALDVLAFDLLEGGRTQEILARGPFDQLWHLAAHLDLGERRAGHMTQVNVGGTERVLVIARALCDVRLQHVGTAYSCGVAHGAVVEDAARGPVVPRNTYERTKHEAEALVRREMSAGLRATIHRPSIVVGDSLTGETEAYGPFYLFARVCHLARRFGPLIVPARPDTRLDLVPVDRVAAAMIAIADRADTEGMTFHLTHPDPPALAEVFRVARDALGLRVAEMRNVTPACLSGPSGVVFRTVGPVLPYLRNAPAFDRTNVDRVLGPDFLAPRVPQAEWLARLLRHGRRNGFGADAGTLLREARVMERMVRAAESRRDVAV